MGAAGGSRRSRSHRTGPPSEAVLHDAIAILSSIRRPSRLSSTMMPVSLLIALLIAFGIEPPATGVPQADVSTRVLETFGGITLIASLAFGLGFWVAFRRLTSGHRPRGFATSTRWAFD